MDFMFAPLGGVLQIAALVALFLVAGAIIGGLLYLAALPGKIAARRNHPQSQAVNICGWLGLPTGGFWVVALVWAYWNYESDLAVNRELCDQIAQLENAMSRLEQQRAGGAV